MHGASVRIQLVELLLASVDDDAALTEFLALLTRLCHAHVATLFIHDFERQKVPFLFTVGLDPSLEQAYQSRFGPVNPWVAEQAADAEGTVVMSHRLLSDATLTATPYYATS